MTEIRKRPLVTLALFSYNQEEYIHQAVLGALDQDYSPLEIIISDDCSTDETFSLIQRLVESYKGPHKVIARQTARNVGPLLHVAEVAKNARGELLVLAAGDDVSKVGRVGVLQQAWLRSGAWGLCSKFDRINADGKLLEAGVRSAVIDSHGFDRYFLPGIGEVKVVHGCTSAYDARIFEYLHLGPSDYILSEDGALSVLLNLLGKKIVHLDESLVLYRENPGALTNNTRKRALSYAEIVSDERNIARFSWAQANRCRLFLRMNEQLGGSKVRELSVDGVKAELRLQEIKTQWHDMPLKAKALAIVHGRVPRTWAWPRAFGRKLFYLAKWLASRFR